MRNSGWYIPFWRKPKKSKNEKPVPDVPARSDEQLEAVRRRWIERYRRTLQALRLLGLSMGSNRAEVQERYELLRKTGRLPIRDLEDAYRYLIRILPPQERRKRRSKPAVPMPSTTRTLPPSITAAPVGHEDEEGFELASVEMLIEEDDDENDTDLIDESDAEVDTLPLSEHTTFPQTSLSDVIAAMEAGDEEETPSSDSSPL